MPTFTDTANRTWTIALGVDVLRRVRNTLAINLADCLVLGDTADKDEPLLGRLHRDPVLLVDLLFVLCRDEAEKAGVDDVAFGQAFDGPVLDAAVAALLGAIDDFFRQPASKLARRIEQERKTRATEATAAIDTMTQEDWDKLFHVAAALHANRYGTPSSSSPASSASTPDAGRSASSSPPPPPVSVTT